MQLASACSYDICCGTSQAERELCERSSCLQRWSRVLSPLENAKGCELANTVYVYFIVIIWFVQCALHTNEPYKYNTLAKVATYQRY